MWKKVGKPKWQIKENCKERKTNMQTIVKKVGKPRWQIKENLKERKKNIQTIVKKKVKESGKNQVTNKRKKDKHANNCKEKGKTQVTKSAAEVLQTAGYCCTFRGKIMVIYHNIIYHIIFTFTMYIILYSHQHYIKLCL